MTCLLHLFDTRREVAELTFSAEDLEGMSNDDMRPWQVYKDGINRTFCHSAFVVICSLKSESIGKYITMCHCHVWGDTESLEISLGPSHSAFIKLKGVEAA